MFFDFIPSVVRCQLFLDLWCNQFIGFIWNYVGKKTVPTNLSKTIPPKKKLKRHPIPMPGGSQRGSLACELPKQETTTRTTNPRIASRTHVLSSKIMFDLASTANVPKQCPKKVKEPMIVRCCFYIAQPHPNPHPEHIWLNWEGSDLAFGLRLGG